MGKDSGKTGSSASLERPLFFLFSFLPLEGTAAILARTVMIILDQRVTLSLEDVVGQKCLQRYTYQEPANFLLLGKVVCGGD